MTVQPCSHTICGQGKGGFTAEGQPRWESSQATVTHFVAITQRDPNGLAQPRDTHLPEISNSVGQRPLCGNVCWHPWVMLNLEQERGYKTLHSLATGW